MSFRAFPQSVAAGIPPERCSWNPPRPLQLEASRAGQPDALFIFSANLTLRTTFGGTCPAGGHKSGSSLFLTR